MTRNETPEQKRKRLERESTSRRFSVSSPNYSNPPNTSDYAIYDYSTSSSDCDTSSSSDSSSSSCSDY